MYNICKRINNCLHCLCCLDNEVSLTIWFFCQLPLLPLYSNPEPLDPKAKSVRSPNLTLLPLSSCLLRGNSAWYYDTNLSGSSTTKRALMEVSSFIMYCHYIQYQALHCLRSRLYMMLNWHSGEENSYCNIDRLLWIFQAVRHVSICEKHIGGSFISQNQTVIEHALA